MTKKNKLNTYTSKDKLKMGLYKVVFKSEFDETKDGGNLVLNIKITRDLQYLLRSFIVENTSVEENVFGGKFIRYKYNHNIFSGIDSSIARTILSKNLIDNGEMKLKFEEIENMERIITYLKAGFKYAIRLVLCGNQETEVIYETNGL